MVVPMTVKQLDETRIQEWVQALFKDQIVCAPQEKGGRFVFEELQDVADLRLDYDTTALPPKKFIQPVKEDLVTFKGGDYESVLESKPFILFGVHPYDVVAISQLDKLFAQGQADVHYLNRRKNCTIVALDVQKPSKDVFAGCMGTAVTQEGWDLLLTRVGKKYVIEAKTAKGEALLKKAPGAAAASSEALKEREEVWEKNRADLRQHKLKTAPEDLPDLLKKSYDSPLWERMAAKCFSCGSCNIVCPTCYCFDVQDDPAWNLDCGTRCRTWDGCLLKDFAMAAGGHNFRKKAAERYRHRFYRKGKYLFDKVGDIACVGCGRCVSACVPRIANPVEVYNSLMEA